MKIFSEIAVNPPKTPVLDKVNLPEDIKNLTPVELILQNQMKKEIIF